MEQLERLERADPGGFVLTGIEPSLQERNSGKSYAEILLLTVNKRFDPFGRHLLMGDPGRGFTLPEPVDSILIEDRIGAYQMDILHL